MDVDTRQSKGGVTMSTSISTTESAYAALDPATLKRVQERHAWVAEPLFRASTYVRTMPFFEWIEELRAPEDFRPAAVQLFHHSATFPKIMGLMLALTPFSENHMMPFYARHAFGEADHHELLMQWILKHEVLRSRQEMDEVLITPATNSCINLGYRLALEADRYAWVLTLNSGIERCSNDLFKALAPKMRSLGAGDVYFDVHVEADEHHSIMGMDYLEPQDPASARGRQLVARALEGVTLWAAMLHSWIGIDVLPQFGLDGRVRRSIRLAA